MSARDVASLGRVGVLLGGTSAEREISLLSGSGVLAALRARGVDAHGFDPGRAALAELAAARFDRVFIALHGRGGEDGTIQGVLETLRIPYTGSGVQASSIALDKLMAKRIWAFEGLPTPAWRALDASSDWDRVVAELGATLIVKPVHEGSTLGITKLGAAPGAGADAGPTAGDEVAAALQLAHATAAAYDAQVLVEQLIDGRELTCTILGSGAAARALPLIEIVAPQGNYDYQNKYFTDTTRYLCPAPLDPAHAHALQQLCLRAYRALGARGWGRVDLMLADPAAGSGGAAQPYLLELNTAPGMTAHSLVPIAGRAAGLDYADLVLEVLAAARLEQGR